MQPRLCDGGDARREDRVLDSGSSGDRLCEAVARLDRAAVRALLDAGAALESRDAQGRTPLGVAAAHAASGLVAMLIDAGADVDGGGAGAPGRALGPAAARAVARREGPERRTPIVCAVESGELECVERLLVAGANPYGAGATTPLDIAALQGDVEITRLLLDHGADPNERDSEGDTPLGIAAAAGAADVCSALLEYGAIAPLRNADGESALDLAAAAGCEEAVEVLAPHFGAVGRWRARRRVRRRPRRSRRAGAAAIEALQRDAQHGRASAVRKALVAGVHPDSLWEPADEAPGLPAVDPGTADHALGLAAEGGHVAVVEALLAAGADPNRNTRHGTPLCRALGPRALDRRACHDVVLALAAAGADPDAPDDDGLTPLMHAVLAGSGDPGLIDLLLEVGADPEAAHPSGMCALDLARADPSRSRAAEHLAACLARRKRGPAAAAASAARPRDERIAVRRGLGDADASCVVLAVRAPIDAVCPAFESLRGGRQWNRDVYGRDGLAIGEEGVVFYQLRGHLWTLGQSAFIDARALHVGDARELSRRLACEGWLLELCPASDVLRYVAFDSGRRVEEFGRLAGGGCALQSSLRTPAQIETARAGAAHVVLEQTLAARELFVPGVGDDRLDWLARRFAPADFERVDFLRLD